MKSHLPGSLFFVCGCVSPACTLLFCLSLCCPACNQLCGRALIPISTRSLFCPSVIIPGSIPIRCHPSASASVSSEPAVPMDATNQQQHPQGNSIREEDDSQTMDNSPPAWASGSPESKAQDLAPPATYDPSSFSAPLNAMPTFKPRKSNRISVLAYNPDGAPATTSSESPSSATEAGRGSPSLPAPHAIGGGPPGLFGSSRSGGLATPSPPPRSPSGVRLPPPPMKNAGSAAAPVPYTKGDFRTAEIVNHWNDPPTQIFEKKTQTDGAAAHDFGPTKEILNKIIKECSENVPVPQKRMFEDTTKRLQSLQEQMDNGTVKDRIIAPLGDMIQALSTRSLTQCHAIHAKLMQTEFDSEGKWLLGFKRLIDLYASLPASS